MDITPDENAADIKLKDIRFHNHGVWKPEDGFAYHYFSEIRQAYLLITSLHQFGSEVEVYYDGGHSTVLIHDMYTRYGSLLFKKSANTTATYDRDGVLLINGKRLA